MHTLTMDSTLDRYVLPISWSCRIFAAHCPTFFIYLTSLPLVFWSIYEAYQRTPWRTTHKTCGAAHSLAQAPVPSIVASQTKMRVYRRINPSAPSTPCIQSNKPQRASVDLCAAGTYTQHRIAPRALLYIPAIEWCRSTACSRRHGYLP
jgi:hypothetical protein